MFAAGADYSMPASFGQSTQPAAFAPTPSRPTTDVGGRLSTASIKPAREKSAVIPVTCHLLWKTAFQSFQLEGTDPSIYGMPLTTSQVAFTACIEKREVDATNITWQLDDGTGTVTARKYSSDDEEKMQFLAAGEFEYVQVVGRMVTDRKSKSWYISVAKMVPVTNGDDIALGVMEAFACAMNPPTETAGVNIASQPATSPPTMMKAETPFVKPEFATIKQEIPQVKPEPVDAPMIKQEVPAAAPAPTVMAGGNLNETVMEVIKASGDAGLHTDKIVAALTVKGFEAGAVQAAVKSLESDGEIWTTTDDNTFAC